jgi:hypothetical protein
VVTAGGCVITGPASAGAAADHAVWKINFSRRPSVDLRIRRLGIQAGANPLVIARRLESRQTLGQDAVEVEYLFDLEVLRGRVQELTCECDPSLQPYEVVAANLQKWEVREAASKGHTALVLRWREPFQSTSAVIRCVAPLSPPVGSDSPGTVSWISPGLRLVNVVRRGESLTLRVPSEMVLEEWHPGGFHLLEATSDAAGQVLRLAGGLLDDQQDAETQRREGAEKEKKSPSPRLPVSAAGRLPKASPFLARPRARIRTPGTDYRIRQLTWWQVGPERSLVTSQLTCEVLRGHLVRLPLTLPPNYELERIDLNPPGQLRSWEVRRERGQTLLLVNLQQPSSPGVGETLDVTRRGASSSDPRSTPETLQLTVQLRSQATSGVRRDTVSLSFPFPDVVPLGARQREGGLGLDFDEQRYEPWVAGEGETAKSKKGEKGKKPVPVSAPRRLRVSAPASSGGPWGKHLPAYFFPYGVQPLRGHLTLRPLPTRLRARSTSTVVLASGRAAMETTLTLQAEAGTTRTLDVWVSTHVADSWEWKVTGKNNTVTGFHRIPAVEVASHLHILAAPNLIGLAPQLAAQYPGECRRLSLARPLSAQEPLTLQVTCRLPRSSDRSRWEVPLLGLSAAGRMDGEVILHLAGADLVQVESFGLREVQSAQPRGQAAVPWRTLRYSQFPVALALRDRAAEVDRSGEAVIDRSWLTTAVRPDGRLIHGFRFRVWNWRQAILPLCLPAGARLLAVRADNSWLDHLPSVTETDDAVQVELPVPARQGTGLALSACRFEIAYVTEGRGWRLWGCPQTAAPVLPVKPIVFRHSWRLSPGMVPLWSNHYVGLPGTPRSELPIAASRLLNADFTSLSNLQIPLSHSLSPARQQQLIEAALKVQAEAQRGMNLGQALEALACTAREGLDLPLLDAAALDETGLSPATPLRRDEGRRMKDDSDSSFHPSSPILYPFWEALGLVLVPGQAVLLLTTPAQRDAWSATSPGTSALPSAVEAAVVEAALHGHDASGRFCRIEHWTRHSGEGRRDDTVLASLLMPPVDLDTPGWSEWEAVPGHHEAMRMHVVWRPAIDAGGLSLAGVLALVFWQLGSWAGRHRLLFLLGWLGLAGLGSLWLPVSLQGLALWPLLLGVLLGLGWYLWLSSWAAFTGPVLAGFTPPRSAVVAAALALLAGAGLASQSGPPAPANSSEVHLLPAPSPRQEVLVPPDLLRQIDVLLQRPGSTPRGAILISAAYSGKATDDRADFEALFQIHNFDALPTTLALPLTGVRVQDQPLLNGAVAYLRAAHPPQLGYQVRIDQPGAHVLRLRFQVPLHRLGEERELSFSIPRVVQSRLSSFELPPGASAFQSLVKQGEVEALKSGEYRVELGRVTAPLQFRWRIPVSGTVAPEVRLSEAYLWDLGADYARLSAVLHTRVVRGAVSSLAIQVADPLEVVAVTTRPGAAGRPAPLVQRWQVQGSGRQRQLLIDFQVPTTGDFHVLLDLLPRRPLGQQAILTVPQPLGVRFDAGFLGYRLRGLEAIVANLGRLGPYWSQRDAVSLLALTQVAGDMPPLPAATYVLQREAGGSPFLQLQLRMAPVRGTVSQELLWRLSDRQASLRLLARATAPAADLCLLEWDVPEEVVITHVTGRDDRDLVRSWGRVGRRLQVWLQRSLPGAELEVVGWKSLASDADGTRFDLPNLRPLSPTAGLSLVRLATGGDMVLEPLSTAGLLPLPDPRWPGRALGYLARGPYAIGHFRVRPEARDITARVLTLVEVRDRQVVFTARVEYRPRWGEVRSVPLRLRNWEGADVRLEARPAAQRQEVRRGSSERSWTLELPPGWTAPCILSLTGSLPQDEAMLRLPVPEVTVPGVGRVEQWLAISPDLISAGPQRLSARGPELLQDWPEEMKRLPSGCQLWQVEGEDWDLQVLPRQRARATGAVRVLLTERRSAVVAPDHWAHQALYWVAHGANTDLDISLPAGAQLLGVAVDGMAVTPLQIVPERLWLPLPGLSGVLCLCLCWTYKPGTEMLEQPRLEGPEFPALIEGPVVWTVQVPAGYSATLRNPKSEIRNPKSEIGFGISNFEFRISNFELGMPALDLARAEAEHRMTAALVEQVREGLPSASRLTLVQRRFYQYCRWAECGLASARSSSQTSLQGQELEAELQDLLKRNVALAQKSGLEAERAEAEQRVRTLTVPVLAGPEEVSNLAAVSILQPAGPRGELVPRYGVPLCWQALAGSETPSLSLQPQGVLQAKRALGVSVLLGVLLVGVWSLACFPVAYTWLRAFWPEQVILLGSVGWLTWGRNTLVLTLFVIGVVARVVLLCRWGIARLRPEQVPPPSGSSASRAPRSSVIRA